MYMYMIMSHLFWTIRNILLVFYQRFIVLLACIQSMASVGGFEIHNVMYDKNKSKSHNSGFISPNPDSGNWPL